MRLLLDTHLLLWAAEASSRLSAEATLLIEDSENELFFSVASIWEVAIKARQARNGFGVDARLLRRNLLNNSYRELLVTGDHAIATSDLPLIYRDPFDRILVAQSVVEGITLLTSDPLVAQYPGPVQRV